MSLPRPPAIPSLLPESAPFTPEQRTWLDGFFSGLLSLEGAVTPLSPEEAARLMPGLLDAPTAPAGRLLDGDDGAAPWHDPTLPLAERMQLADGRPLRRRMMAAMGQQDCGQCGYNCADYADAIFRRQEERLNLCVPGGKDTARMLKKLYQELDLAPAVVRARSADAAEPSATAAAVADAASRAEPGRSREHPVAATFR